MGSSKGAQSSSGIPPQTPRGGLPPQVPAYLVQKDTSKSIVYVPVG